MDRHGRVFFIDHKNRTTTWQKPEIVTHPPVVNNGDADGGIQRESAEVEDTPGNKFKRVSLLLTLPVNWTFFVKIKHYSYDKH